MTEHDELQALREKLTEWDQSYDPEAKMFRRPFSSPGYHTKLTGGLVHPTRESLVYAVALLDSGLPGNDAKGLEVIEKVISLQDRDRRNGTYGIWSWFLEEPLEQMAPPDWNWADFCGKQLVLAVSRHLHKMDARLSEKVRQAIFAACDAIIKRNVGPGYTNIAIMGTFVTLIAGERYDHPPFVEYGLDRLRRFRQHTLRLGTFQEYNSPNYTPIAIRELSSILGETALPDAKALTEELLDIGWLLTAEHFHAATRQWAGPHSRCYSTVLKDETLSFLELALERKGSLLKGRETLYDFDFYRNPIRCPEKYREAFYTPANRTIRQKVTEGAAEVWATTVMGEDVALGTFDREVMWNQRRNWLAYLRNGDGFSYVALRFLHDGYDYSSAVFASAQDGFDTVFALGFCTDGGDTHIHLDQIDGTIEAADLRLRFEIGGLLDGIRTAIDGNAAEAAIGGHVLQVRLLSACCDEFAPRWEATETEDTQALDLVLYNGNRRTFDFRAVERAALALLARIAASSDAGVRLKAEAEERDGMLHASVEVGGGNRSAAIPVRPSGRQHMLGRIQLA